MSFSAKPTFYFSGRGSNGLNTEKRLVAGRGREVWGPGVKGEGLERCRLAATKCHGNVGCGVGEMVSNVVTPVCGARWITEISRCAIGRVCDCLATVLYI